MTKVLLTALLDQKDVPSFAQASKQGLPNRYPVFTSILVSTDVETLSAVLADHALKLAQFGGGNAEER